MTAFGWPDSVSKRCQEAALPKHELENKFLGKGRGLVVRSNFATFERRKQPFLTGAVKRLGLRGST